jgi:hypothetical protein
VSFTVGLQIGREFANADLVHVYVRRSDGCSGMVLQDFSRKALSPGSDSRDRDRESNSERQLHVQDLSSWQG